MHKPPPLPLTMWVMFLFSSDLECQCTSWRSAIPEDQSCKTTGLLSVMRSWMGMAWKLNSGILTLYMCSLYPCTSFVTCSIVRSPFNFDPVYIADCKGYKYTLHGLARGKRSGSESLRLMIEFSWAGHYSMCTYSNLRVQFCYDATVCYVLVSDGQGSLVCPVFS